MFIRRMLKNYPVFRPECTDIGNTCSVGKCSNGFLFIKKKNIAYRITCLLIVDKDGLREKVTQNKKEKD